MRSVAKTGRTLRSLALAGFGLMLFSVVAPLIVTPKASALSGSDFNPGHIIDDTIFTNSSAMSPQDIQNFLTSKVPTCDTNGTQLTSHPNGSGGYYTRAQWGAINGNSAPFTCLKDYVENVSTLQNNFHSPGTPVPGGIGAANIIWNAAQTYHINPQVILTTLQKEQGLVTDDWPWYNEYQYAMGYACPDSAGCSGSYADFFKQVDGAAWQFRYYLDHPNAFNYWTGDNYIQYNPNASCGGSVVNIQNPATAALYIYTPYQPNAGALAGVSDSSPGGTAPCGAYGNRNFWWYFNEWFGSSLSSGYAWQLLYQGTFTDSSLSTPLDATNLLPGQRFYVLLKAENIGSVTWQRGVSGRQVDLGTTRPMDRRSGFCDSSWLGTNCNRPSTTNEATVAPGQTGTFGFWATAWGVPGVYNEYFNLVMDGTSWMSNDPGLYWTFGVRQPSWQPVYQGAFTDNSLSTPVDTNNLGPNQKYYLLIKAKNTGSTSWQQGAYGRQVNVGTDNFRDRRSGFCDASWLGSSCNRPTTSAEATVAPGQTGTFGFWITTPSKTLQFNEYFSLVMDGTSWLTDPGLYWSMAVNAPQLAWQPIQQSAYTDNTQSTPVDTLNLRPGERFYLVVKARNQGNVVWQQGVAGRQVNLGTSHPIDRTSGFCDASWLGSSCNRPTTSAEANVGIGQTGTFGFWATAPTQSGNYNEYFNLVMDGTTWSSNDPGLYWTLRVN